MRTGPIAVSVALAVIAAGCASSPSADTELVTTTSTTTVTTTIPPASTIAATTSTVALPAPTSAPSTSAPAPEPVELAETPDGRFRFSVSYPVAGDFLSNGVLMVDDGRGPVPALRDERDAFDEVHDMVFGPDGLVAWGSNDYNDGAWMFLGRIDDTGRIVDSRRVGDPRSEVMVRGEFDDTTLVGEAYGGEEIVVDTAHDPFFVMSADPVPGIETDSPLVPVLESDGYWAREQPGFWYRGATLGRDPACGAGTLYKDDADGFARVLDASIEIDSVVDVDVDEDFGTGGIDTVGAARVVVLSTECPPQYEGRRVYWGIETIDYGDRGPRVEWPLVVEPAPHSPVAEVLAVTAVIPEVDCCPWPSLLRIDVELLSGTRTTIEVAL
jgi:hypothetical protein